MSTIIRVLAGASLALSAHPVFSQTTSQAGNQPDWLSQAKIVAEMEGVTVGEAMRRARLQELTLEQAARFESDPDYAGSWIDRSGHGYKVVFAFKNRKQPHINNPDLASVSSIANAGYSLGEMKSEIARLGNLLKRKGIQAAFAIEFKRNRVVLQTPDPDAVNKLVSAGELQLRDFVFVTRGGAKGRDEAVVEGAGETYGEFRDPADGYLYANPCTAAFNFSNGSVRGISTSGHCNETSGRTQTHRGLPIGNWMDSRNSGGLDVAWFRNSNTYPNRVRWTSTSYYTITTVAPIPTTTDIPICIIRRDTTQSCGWVHRIIYIDYGTNGPFVEMDRDVTAGGDSGAPWLYGGKAYGVHKGDWPGDDGVYRNYFTPASSLP